MPEYLAPGVFIEEVPARLKAIEGVSTSTAAFVGPAQRGPIPGFPLPFNGEPAGYVVPRDAAPRLVTSYADFVRTFGDPLPMPDVGGNGFLARAVRAFFDNGGKRLYVARIVTDDTTNRATRSILRLHQGVALQLATPTTTTSPLVRLTSLRGVGDAGSLEFRRRDGTVLQTIAITSYDTANGTVTLDANPAAHQPEQVYVTPLGLHPNPNGAQVYARNPGDWSARVKVSVLNADRGPVPITANAATADTQIAVQATGSFYRGAIVEIDDGSERVYREVTDVLPGRRLQLATALGVTINTGNSPFARVCEIDIVVQDESGSTPALELHRALSWNPNPLPEVRRRHYATVINSRSNLIYIRPPAVAAPPSPPAPAETAESAINIRTQPMTLNGFPVDFETAGTVGGLGAAPDDNDYVGVDTGPGTRTGIASLQEVEDARILAAPGRSNQLVHNALITQCERLRYRFAVLDGVRDHSTVADILTHRNAYDTSFAAYYAPWLEIIENDQQLLVPPSGYLAGIYARTDVERGVHKAPANEVVRGITGLARCITVGEQEILNPRGVNAIRRFEGRGTRVWGARTLASDPEFRYVNVRRFLIFLEASLDRGTQWAVFEPNAPETWQRVTNSVTAFLHTQWQNGALFGRTPEQAFFVRCDETTMSVDDIQNGRLICEIGVAIVRPAEFVIFRIEQITGFGEEA